MNCIYLRIWKLNTVSKCSANELKFYLIFSKDIYKCTVKTASFLNSTIQTTCSPTGVLWQKASPFNQIRSIFHQKFAILGKDIGRHSRL